MNLTWQIEVSEKTSKLQWFGFGQNGEKLIRIFQNPLDTFSAMRVHEGEEKKGELLLVNPSLRELQSICEEYHQHELNKGVDYEKMEQARRPNLEWTQVSITNKPIDAHSTWNGYTDEGGLINPLYRIIHQLAKDEPISIDAFWGVKIEEKLYIGRPDELMDACKEHYCSGQVSEKFTAWNPSEPPKLEWRTENAIEAVGGIEYRGHFIRIYRIAHNAYSGEALAGYWRDDHTKWTASDRAKAKQICQQDFNECMLPPALGYRDTESSTPNKDNL